MVRQRRYQVFVSSTYQDLVEERQQAIQAVMSVDCIPVGMEIFPAAHETPWKLIERTIRDSDYYVVIIGGRYGSLDERGVSFTEREYEHAMSLQTPVLVFLHRDPLSLPMSRSELDVAARSRLHAFRQRLERTHTCKYWTNASELSAQLTASLVHAIQTTPRPGWTRSECAAPRLRLPRLESLSEDSLDTLIPREPPDGSCSYALQFTRGPKEIWSDTDDYDIDKFRGHILWGRHSDYEWLAGQLEFSLIRCAEYRFGSEACKDLFDAVAQTYWDLFDALYDPDTGKPRVQLDLVCPPEAGYDILYIENIELLPSHRGKRLGLALARILCDTFRGGCGMIVADTAPAAYKHDSNDPWTQRLDLFRFPRDRQQASKRITEHFSKVGFRIVPGTELMVLDPHTEGPTLYELLGV